LPAATASLLGNVLTVVGTPDRDNIHVSLDAGTNQLVVRSFADTIGVFDSAAVGSIAITTGAGDDIVTIDNAVTQPAAIDGGTGRNILKGGGGPTNLVGAAGPDKLIAGTGVTNLNGDGGSNLLFDIKPVDTAVTGPMDRVAFALPVIATPGVVPAVLTTAEVGALLDRASAATPSTDAIIAIVDRNGRILGLREEGGVSTAITGNTANQVFAIDGALAEARTAAFFANAGAPLTSRTIQFISQTTITQREVESNPSIADPDSTVRGPGFVAPIGIKGHFPPNVANTPQVDLFGIEGTNRDTSLTPSGQRFNIDPAFVPPGFSLTAPDSYGLISGLAPGAKPRGIGTLPGGIPIYKNNQVVGGIGVFFPGKTGYADEENSSLSSNYDPTKPDRSLEAEYIGFAALGGLPSLNQAIGPIAGIPLPPNLSLSPALPPGQALRIDLVGITLDIFGQGGRMGSDKVVAVGQSLGVGTPSGTNLAVDAANDTLLAGKTVPDGYLVVPHDGVGITAAQVQQIIQNGITETNTTRAAIRLPMNSAVKMVFAVADLNGNIVGLYREPDATIFSIDVAVAKARNVAYYASQQLQAVDQVPGVPVGTALTNRSFRYLALPHFPEGVDSAAPGPFSILNDGAVDPTTGLNVGPPLPASAYQSVMGYDAFNPGTNFRDPNNKANQNGIVFFPGSSPLYAGGGLIGGFGVSGDGVDQDDVVTAGGAKGFEPNPAIRIDQLFVRGIRVPYQKFNRNPQGGLV
jgi:uncharacterized protein GlcG (DUF336 family)